MLKQIILKQQGRIFWLIATISLLFTQNLIGMNKDFIGTTAILMILFLILGEGNE